MTQATTNQKGTDEATLAVMAAVATIFAFGLTSVGVLAVALPLSLYWLTGRPNIALATLLVAFGLFGFAIYLGEYGIILAEFQRGYVDEWGRGEVLKMAQAWLWFIKDRSAWAGLGPVGLAIGSGLTLTWHDRANSSLYALINGQVVPNPARAPLAPLFRKRIAERPSKSGSSTVLGSDWRTGATVTISNRDLNRHVLLAGTTGSGKTTSLSNIIESAGDCGTVVVDGKADVDLAERVQKFAERNGRKFYLFDATGQLPSCVYNPLASGDATSLTDRIMTLSEWTEPYYMRLAEGFLQTTFKTLHASRHPVDLVSVAEMLDVTRLLATIRHAGGKVEARNQKLVREIRELRKSEAEINGLRTEIGNFARSTLGPLFDTERARLENIPIFDLKKAREENAIVYFCLPALVYSRRATSIGKLIVNDIKFVASTAKTPWRLIFDEFSVFAGPQVLTLLNQGRGYGLCVTLSTQSISDIAQGAEKNAADFVNQVFGSINSYIIHRLNAANDCELIASVAGTKQVVDHTAQTIGGKGTGAASARHTREYIVHPDAIKSLGIGDAYFINKNASSAKYIKTRKSRI